MLAFEPLIFSLIPFLQLNPALLRKWLEGYSLDGRERGLTGAACGRDKTNEETVCSDHLSGEEFNLAEEPVVAGDTHSFERRLQKLAYRVTLSKAEGLKERRLELIQAHLWAADVTRSLGLGWEPRSRKKSGEPW